MSDTQIANQGNLLGVDYGDKRIGLALAEQPTLVPHPLTTIPAEQSIKKILQYCQEHRVGTIVLGLPRSLQGRDTDQTRKVRQFYQRLQQTTELMVELQDEAATSLLAAERLKQRQKSWQSSEVDQEAAVIILEDYIGQNES